MRNFLVPFLIGALSGYVCSHQGRVRGWTRTRIILVTTGVSLCALVLLWIAEAVFA